MKYHFCPFAQGLFFFSSDQPDPPSITFLFLLFPFMISSSSLSYLLPYPNSNALLFSAPSSSASSSQSSSPPPKSCSDQPQFSPFLFSTKLLRKSKNDISQIQLNKKLLVHKRFSCKKRGKKKKSGRLFNSNRNIERVSCIYPHVRTAQQLP